jgi:hypothetical protein
MRSCAKIIAPSPVDVALTYLAPFVLTFAHISQTREKHHRHGKQLKGGEFPTLRYSDEETERLLAEAYAAIPPRAGKRGTLNLKRQKGRAFVRMQYHYKKKLERIGAHERRMAKRKRTNDEIKRCRSEAEDVRARERDYQDMVLQRWAMMNGYGTTVGGSSNETAY